MGSSLVLHNIVAGEAFRSGSPYSVDRKNNVVQPAFIHKGKKRVPKEVELP